MQRLFASQATLHKLEVFCLVCQLQSVTRAADKIGVAQPVVTAHLRFLEDKLGVRLFAKEGRRIVLTEAGEKALEWATEIVTRTREFERALGVPTGDLAGSAVLAASMTVASYSLPPSLARFSQLYPSSTVMVSISHPQGVTEAVRSGECDFGLTILDPRHHINELVVERLWEEQLVLVTAPDDPHLGASATIKDLEETPFVSAFRNQVRRQIEDDALRAYGIVRNNVRLEFGHPEAIKQAVRANGGAAFVMESSVREELATGRLRHVAMPQVSLPVPTFMVHRKGKSFSRIQKLLLDYLRNELKPAGR